MTRTPTTTTSALSTLVKLSDDASTSLWSNDEISLSLLQCIRVHEALLDVVVAVGGGVVPDGTAVQEFAYRDGSPRENRILMIVQYQLRLHRDGEKNPLGCVFTGLKIVLLPLLLSPPPRSRDEAASNAAGANSAVDNETVMGENNDAMTTLETSASLENDWSGQLRNALVEAAIVVPLLPLGGQPCNETLDDIVLLAESCFQSCLEALHSSVFPNPSDLVLLSSSSSAPPAGVWNPSSTLRTVSRILSRLQKVLESTEWKDSVVRPRLLELVKDTMHKVVAMVCKAICFDKALVASKGQEYVWSALARDVFAEDLFKVLTSSLIPQLYNNDNATTMTTTRNETNVERTTQLWLFCVELLETGGQALSSLEENRQPEGQEEQQQRRLCRNHQDVIPTVISGVLSFAMPAILSACHGMEPPPMQHVVLKDFVLQSLSRMRCAEMGGVSPKKKGAGGSVEGTSRQATKEEAGVDQMLRRRGLHILRHLVDFQGGVQLWDKYLVCFETLEMEVETHLIDQTWDIIAELSSACRPGPGNVPAALFDLSWEWMSALLCRVLLSDSPTIRKLGLFRLLRGDAGISVATNDTNEDDGLSLEEEKKKKPPPPTMGTKPSKKHKIKGTKKGKRSVTPAPLHVVSPAFVMSALVPSYDSIVASVGTNMHFEQGGKVVKEDIRPRMMNFVGTYVVASHGHSPSQLGDFVAALFQPEVVHGIRTQTLEEVLSAVAAALERSRQNGNPLSFPLSVDALSMVADSLEQVFSGSIVRKFMDSILQSLAVMLASAAPFKAGPHPLLLLRLLQLFPSPIQPPTGDSTTTLVEALARWLGSMVESQPRWAAHAGAGCASAYVSGHLLASSPPLAQYTGPTQAERDAAAAIVKLCVLAGGKEASSFSPKEPVSCSAMLWPAIHKGLSKLVVVGGDSTILSADSRQQVTRAVLLLESGAKERILSGLGHGDLVVDKTSGEMMPPPADIERLLVASVGFLLQEVQLATTGGRAQVRRKGGISAFTYSFARLIRQLRTLKLAYPSSRALLGKVGSVLQRALVELRACDNPSKVTQMALAFAALSGGAEFVGLEIREERREEEEEEVSAELVTVLSDLVDMEYVIPPEITDAQEVAEAKAARSIFQFAKWGTLSLLVTALEERSTDFLPASFATLLPQVLTAARDAVHATPEAAMLPLFETAMICARMALVRKKGGLPESDLLESVISTLLAVMTETGQSHTKSRMLHLLCRLLFRSHLLQEEYRLLELGVLSAERAPLLGAFGKIMALAGTKRPHIAKAAVSCIVVGWLPDKGLSAIPYRDEIVNLLLFKEVKLDASSVHQERLVGEQDDNDDEAAAAAAAGEKQAEAPPSLCPPNGTDELSVIRGFVMVFFSKLPHPDEGLPTEVRTNLCHYIILQLLYNVCSVVPPGGSLLMTGSLEYNRKIRAWQALCLLSRFVTREIAKQVATAVFDCMSQVLHGQVRYFLEIFAVQCARRHATIFAVPIRNAFTQRDLSLQHVSSLMIISGNLMVGRYAEDFMNGGGGGAPLATSQLRDILYSAIPWLGSTQGFSRAIAQLLVYHLVPLCRDSQAKNGDSSPLLLQVCFDFLERNPEMVRLRQKQMKFFHGYDANAVCTPQGLLLLPVDSAHEADPPHLVEAMKQCLEEVYKEAHDGEAPFWKQMDEALLAAPPPSLLGPNAASAAAAADNVQRKILPLDALQLTLEEYREDQLTNAVSRRKQELIVCASLLDKVPNLAGLARTAEVFAAQRLVLHDLQVAQMDSFKNMSVSAEEWIAMEECREADLLPWLRRRRNEGYRIVGLEQTSSSVELTRVQFEPRTVLLLGKEKEGIPMEYLHAVDTCVEIPQWGIIRSLNVHVSGAVAIWEYTKQMMQRNV